MKLLFCERNLFMQRDIEDALTRMGIDFRCVSYVFNDPNPDDFYASHLRHFLSEDTYDAVLSVNAVPVIADVCHDMRIPYLAWCYDACWEFSRTDIFYYPSTYIFHFDRRSCEDSLRILLDFVTHPYFTKETVEKEQGIIGQEITMYYDVPGWMSTFNLLKCLYKNHPVRIDIAGTVESISHITDKLLYDCYDTFYNLNNMALAVVGNVDVESVLSVCDEVLKKSADVKIERAFEPEPREIVKPYDEYYLSVGMPVFSFGYKEACKTPLRTVKELVEMNVLLEILAGETSPLYTGLFEKGLINSSFSKEYFVGNGYESVIFDGESNNAGEVAEAIKAEVENLRKNGFSDERFEAARRSLYGKEIMSYNDIDGVANSIIASYFGGFGAFDALDVYKNVKKSDIEKLLSEKLDEKYSALSVVKSKEN